MTASQKLFANCAARPVPQYKVQYISKEDNHEGAYNLCMSIEEAEAVKAEMEKAWGASCWSVVIKKI